MGTRRGRWARAGDAPGPGAVAGDDASAPGPPGASEGVCRPVRRGAAPAGSILSGQGHRPGLPPHPPARPAQPRPPPALAISFRQGGDSEGANMFVQFCFCRENWWLGAPHFLRRRPRARGLRARAAGRQQHQVPALCRTRPLGATDRCARRPGRCPPRGSLDRRKNKQNSSFAHPDFCHR